MQRKLDRTRLLLGLLPPDEPLGALPRLGRRLRTLGLYVEGTGRGESLSEIHHTSRHAWVRDLERRPISADRIARIPDVLGPKLRWIAPAEQHGSELLATLPDVLLVAARPNADSGLLARVLGTYGLEEWVEKSRYLGRWRYFRVERPAWATAEQIGSALLKREGRLIERVHYEYFAHASPLRLEPNDLFYERQWAPLRIGAPEAWDIAAGEGVVVAVIDSGCELDHPDLRFTNRGVNLEDLVSEGSPVGVAVDDRSHGTQCAGVIGAGLDNFHGVAGVAGRSRLLPLAADSFTHATVAMGIRIARDNGARVINMSFQTPTYMFETSVLREAIDDAVAAGVVICASSGNGNGRTLILPARHPDVIACGASDRSDRRWVSSPTLGSHYGDGMYLGRPVGVGVVAPGIDIFTTDLIGPEGMNPGASPYGDYAHFNATSAAAPHVSALAAMILSLDDTLTAEGVRRLIERTAEKVGGYVYRDVAGYPNGTRHPEVGHGRIHAFRALDLGDVMIADWPEDDGVEPSTPPDGNYWTTSDLVVRPTADGVFDPMDPEEASRLEPHRDHTIYARVSNVGPSVARNVDVDVRVAPWVGLEFVYPDDWEDPLHIRPASVDTEFPSLSPTDPPRLARFTLSAEQVDVAAGWVEDMMWHPCILGVTKADNDYAFQAAAGGPALQTRRNNLAQRNLTVRTGAATRSLRFPFVMGHPADRERMVELIVEAGRAARDGRVQLLLDDDGLAFPVLGAAQAFAAATLDVARVEGGKASGGKSRRRIVMTGSRMVVTVRLPRPGRYPLELAIQPPRDAVPGERFTFWIAQRSLRRGVVGGATLVHTIT